MQAETSRILPSSCCGFSFGRGSRASPSGCRRPELLLSAPGGQPGAEAATSPCPVLGDGFFFPCVLQLGPFIIGKKENDQASRLENKET